MLQLQYEKYRNSTRNPIDVMVLLRDVKRAALGRRCIVRHCSWLLLAFPITPAAGQEQEAWIVVTRRQPHISYTSRAAFSAADIVARVTQNVPIQFPLRNLLHSWVYSLTLLEILTFHKL